MANVALLQPGTSEILPAELSDFPFPGTIGGGSLPSVAANTVQGIAALNLVPEGLTPIAVFPPYQTPRTFTAVSVIWLENTASTGSRKATIDEKKGMYGLWTKEWRQMNYKRHHVRKDALIRDIFSKKEKLRDKMKKLRDDIHCNKRKIQLRKRQRTRNNSKPLHRFINSFKEILKPISNFFPMRKKFQHNPSYYKCLEKEVEVPKFGFRTLITLVDQEPCILGVSCTIDGQRINKKSKINKEHHEENNTVQEDSHFEASEKFKWTDSGFKYLRRNRRQTGEKISASILNCRLNLDESDKSCVKNKP